MSSLVAALFIVVGLSCLVGTDWWADFEREVKARGTTQDPDDIELTETRIASIKVAGIACLLFGLLVAFDVI